MDPEATVRELLEAMHDNDRERVDELLDALKDWNDKQGYLPSLRCVERDSLHAEIWFEQE